MDNRQTSEQGPPELCAKRILAEQELRSPAFRKTMEGMPREIVMVLMAMAFVEGTLHGAREVALGLKGAA